MRKDTETLGLADESSKKEYLIVMGDDVDVEVQMTDLE